MIGTKQWISNCQKLISDEKDNRNHRYFQTILIKGKKISQIISYIWLNQDEEAAKKLDGYFKRGKDEELKKLLFANDPETDEYKLLIKVFKEERFLPIFDEDDKQYFKFRVTVDKFEGNLSDPGPSDEEVLTMTIPYPPRPNIFDDSSQNKVTPLDKSQLQEWLDQNPEEKPYFYEDNPYIPTTTS
ncbi:MAG: hypothetical protein V7L20_31650 [Nostoc sp.]|uniref:hypothetical protein n=1 Tax=Nostoc sp. TaxID=1180 RepID=UPI002FF4A691